MAFHTVHSDLVLGDLERCSYHNSMGPLQSLHLLVESVESVWSCFDDLEKSQKKTFYFRRERSIVKITLLKGHLIKQSILK